MLVIDNSINLHHPPSLCYGVIKKGEKNMKTLKQLALVALVCCGSLVMATTGRRHPITMPTTMPTAVTVISVTDLQNNVTKATNFAELVTAINSIIKALNNKQITKDDGLQLVPVIQTQITALYYTSTDYYDATGTPVTKGPLLELWRLVGLSQ